MSTKTDNIPDTNKTAFSCPHCNALTTQYWHNLYAMKNSDDQRTPTIPSPKIFERLDADRETNNEVKESVRAWAKKMLTEKPFFERKDDRSYLRTQVLNVNISECYNCHELTIWVHDRIIYPNSKSEIIPNPDLPAHIQKLFEEAREIVSASPKGAAALLRLCVQHLCKELGESGKNIDQDIASLVGKGLNPLVQQALDVVRVIGNESVHPGEIDLNDDRETAHKLFNVINLIAQQMITHPKEVQAMYEGLPEQKLKGIENRNKRAKKEES